MSRGMDAERALAAKRLFRFICLANVCLYLEAGAVPAMLVVLSNTFRMSQGQQGLLGGVVYLAISVGGPFAGYSFKKYHQKKVLGNSLIANNMLLIAMALCPDQWAISSWLFIVLRAALGLTQCFLCVYSPIWIDEFAPNGQRTSWMSFIQAAVPIGIMAGYAMSALLMWATRDLGWTHSWRLPFLVQGLLEMPFVLGFWMTSSSLVCVRPPMKAGQPPATPRSEAPSESFTPDASQHPSTPGRDGHLSPVKVIGSPREERPEDVVDAALMPPPRRRRGEGRPIDGYEGEAESDMSPDPDDDQFPPLSNRALSLRQHMRQSSINAALYSPHITTNPLEQFDRMPSSENLYALCQRAALLDEDEDIESGLPYPSDRTPLVIGQDERAQGSDTFFVMKNGREDPKGGNGTGPPRNLAQNGYDDQSSDGEEDAGPRRRAKRPLRRSSRRLDVPEKTALTFPPAAPPPTPATPSPIKILRRNRRDLTPQASLQAQSDTDGYSSAVAVNRSGTPSQDRRSFSCSQVMRLFTDKIYVMIVFSISSLYFVVTGVQYWGTTYLLVALGGDQLEVNVLFVITAATAPTAGVFFGGWLVDRCGGYRGLRQRIKALRLCFFLGVLSTAAGVPATFTKNIYTCVVLLWILLFFGGSLLPACTGILVSIVPRKMREISTATSLVIFNLFGYSMSLVLSGYVMEVIRWVSIVRQIPCDDACVETWGFRVVLFWPIWSLVLLLGAIHECEVKMARREQGRLVQDEAGNGAPTAIARRMPTEASPLLGYPQREMEI